MNIMEAIRSAGYTIEKGHKLFADRAENRTTNLPFLYLFYNGEKRLIIPKQDKEIILGGSRSFTSCDEALQGGALFLRALDIYKAYYNLNEEETCYLEHGFGLRSWKYNQSTMDEIGLIRMDERVDSTSNGNPSDLPEYSPVLCDFLNAAAHYGKVGDAWLVEIASWYVIDDYVVEKFYFSKRPTQDSLHVALDVRKVCKLLKDRRSETYTCWECGRELHWLDCIPNGIHEKLNCLEEKYCGC